MDNENANAEELFRRLEAAEAEVAKWIDERDEAKAECERLRDENESLREQLDEALAKIESMWKTIAP